MQCTVRQLRPCSLYARSSSPRTHVAKPQGMTSSSRQRVLTVAQFSSDERIAKKAQEENLDNMKRVAGMDAQDPNAGNSRRTLLALGAVAALLVASKIMSNGKQPRAASGKEAVMQVAMANSKLSDNPVANDAVKVLEESKAESLQLNINNTISKDVSGVGIQRMEVPQGKFISPNPNRLEGNENFAAATASNAGPQNTDRNALQRFTDATNRNISENVIKGSKPPFAK